MGIVLVPLVPAYYWFENYTGRRALEKVVAEYAESGFPLEAEAVLPAAVPDTENFGATPLLDGIMDAESKSGTTKRKFLKDLLPRSRGPAPRPAGLSKTKAEPGVVPLPSVVPPAVADHSSIDESNPQWPNIRAYLIAYTTCKPPADETSDVRAVYEALEVHRAVFDELIAAAQRPLALLTPPPRERIDAWRQGDVFCPTSELMNLSRFVLMRSRAAAALGRNDEAAALSSVIWKLGRASLPESTVLSHYVAKTIERLWISSVGTIVRGRQADDPMLLELLGQCGSDWSPEKDLQRTFRGEGSYLTASFRGLLAQASDFGNSLGSPSFEERMIRYGPSGWVDHNIATGLRRIHRHYLSPLATGGFATLPASCDVMDSITSSSMEQWAPDRFLGVLSGLFTPLSKGIVSHAQRIRLTLLAIAMERYRLKHGRYPPDATALVPDCIAAVPPDIDGAPLRVVTPADGATSVIYSIGWNLTDDWHGVIPATYKEEYDWQNADWQLALPFPPLPPP